MSYPSPQLGFDGGPLHDQGSSHANQRNIGDSAESSNNNADLNEPACPPGMDAGVFGALPIEMQREVAQEASPSPHHLAFDGGPLEDQTSSPPAPLNGLTIASIILCLCGIGAGLAAGHYAKESQFEFNTDQNMDQMMTQESRQKLARVMAQLFGFLGIAAFATAIPLLACGARGYQNIRGSKGLPVMMLIAWIAYGLGMMDALILLASSILRIWNRDIETVWVYLAVLYNVIPYAIMMSHAEYSRRR